MVDLSTNGLLKIAKMINDYFETAWKYDSSSSSLIQRANMTLVEPLYLIDNLLKSSEVLPDLNNTMLSFFAAFYIQAIAATNADSELRIQETLEVYSPNPNAFAAARRKYLAGLESYQEVNPFTKQPIYSTEDDEVEYHKGKINSVATDKLLSDFKESYAHAVGKIVTITFKKNIPVADGKYVEKSLDVPIGIRLITGYVPGSDVVDTMTFSQVDQSAFERKLAFKLGKMSLIKDILLCRDMYVNARKLLKKDKTGYFQAALSRQNSSVLYKLLMQRQQFGGISTLVAITDTTFRALQDKLNAKFNNSSVRNELFQTSGTMILAVVDENYRMVKFYFHSIDMPLEASFKDLKKPGKDKIDLTEVLSALNMGNAPRL